MDFFGLLSMIGGLALFLYGMQMMSNNLACRSWLRDLRMQQEAR